MQCQFIFCLAALHIGKAAESASACLTYTLDVQIGLIDSPQRRGEYTGTGRLDQLKRKGSVTGMF